LCSYIISIKQKCLVFLLIFYLFLFNKIKEQEGGTGPGWWAPVGGRKVKGKRSRRVNTVKKCVHAKKCVNAKMIPIETIPGIRGGRIKESIREGDFKCDILDTL
jgi:hypothetical protein